jgi:hypothetical protein
LEPGNSGLDKASVHVKHLVANVEVIADAVKWAANLVIAKF